MAGYGDYAPTEIGRVVRPAFRSRSRLPPGFYETLDIVLGDLCPEMDIEVYQERNQSPDMHSLVGLQSCWVALDLQNQSRHEHHCR